MGYEEFKFSSDELLERLPPCHCCDANTLRTEIIRKHGTYEEFEAHVNKSRDAKLVSKKEADRALRKYKKQLKEARE